MGQTLSATEPRSAQADFGMLTLIPKDIYLQILSLVDWRTLCKF